MKVLFAVNNDNVSEAIAKKYQREYKDILSYKNVYYFNAIIRELQKEKDYNRIVISEDLEPFANNNYNMIDKFLLEKYTNISKEAKTLNEERIEIILLCADRRKKTEDIFVKLHNLEIYNAIIGQDRSIDEVCKLIYSPRDKNFARQYYDVPISELAGQEESDNSVSEEEIENIRAHYKRLGKNEDKYVDSFNNIISQYTDTQLKIIIKYLPIHVKAVLEERSSKYQQLVTAGLPGQNTDFDMKANKYKQKTQKKGFWKSKKEEDDDDDEIEETLIDREFTTPKLTQPIVIPSDMNTENVQKINVPNNNTQESTNTTFESQKTNDVPSIAFQENDDFEQKIANQQSIDQQKRNEQDNKQKNLNNPQTQAIPEPQQIQKPEIPMQERPMPQQIERPEIPVQNIPDVQSVMNQNVQETVETQPVVQNENKIEQTVGVDLFDGLLDVEEEQNTTKAEDVQQNEKEEMTTVENVPAPDAPVKRGRGRPRTKPIVEVDPNQPKRGRGRPRKQPVAVEQEVQEEIKEEQPSNVEEIQQENDLFSMSEQIEQNNKTEVNSLDNSVEQNDTPLDLFNMDNNEKQNDAPVDLFNMDNNEKQNDAPVDLFNMDNNEITSTKSDETNDRVTNEGTIPDYNTQQIPQQSDNQPIEESTTNNQQVYNQPTEVEPMNIPQQSSKPQEDEIDLFNTQSNSNTVDLFENSNNNITTTNRTNAYSNLNTLLTADKKIVAFVGTTKNGTSFVVNNTAEMLASMGISTAVLDLTKTKNAYYIYTNNEEQLRQISAKCMKNLENGIPEGLKISKTLTVYTEMPGEEENFNIDNVLSTLVQNYSAVLIDTDFDTPIEIFERVQEIYLVQSMDVLTIQPLTAFLRNLKSKNILKQEKIKIVINKSQRIKSLNVRTLIGGMSCYNAPNMSYMTELFDKDNVKYCEIPFETQNYIKYLDSLVNCSITLNGYTKTLLTSLRELANIVYPLVGKQTYSPMNGNNKKDPFSKQMSSTLNKMKNKGY